MGARESEAWSMSNDSELDSKNVKAMCGAVVRVARAMWFLGTGRSLGMGGQTDTQSDAPFPLRV